MTSPIAPSQAQKTPEILLTEEKDIVAAFDRSKVPWRAWKEPYDLEHLLASLRENQVRLIDFDPKPVLHVQAAVVYLMHQKEGGRLIELYEAYQWFRQSKVRKTRGFRGLGETMKKTDASPLLAAQRLLAEEPGYTEEGFKDPRNYALDFFMPHELEQLSDKYASLPSVFHRKVFHCKIINPDIYDPDGYWEYEAEEDKETHFEWKEI